MKKEGVNKEEGKPETTSDLKKETMKEEPVKKGYNEQNPIQPHGSFKPDNASDKK